MRIFALQHMRNAAAEFDDLQPALDIALTVGNYLAMFGAEQMRQLVHIGFDQPLEFEHHPRPPLRIGRRPARLRGKRGLHRQLQRRRIAQRHTRLNAAIIGVEHIAEPCCGASAPADEMVDLPHNLSPASACCRQG